MMDVSDLYQAIIMDHRNSPRNLGKPENLDHEADGFNPFCGDRVSVGLRVEDGVITDIGFDGEGCAISTASASLMTETVMGKSIADAVTVFDGFRELLTGGESSSDLGDLEALAGVKAFPTRIKCAILSWHTLKAALDKSDDTVTTE